MGDERVAIEYTKRKSLKAVQVLYRLMSSSSEGVRLPAAQALLDRGLGRPVQALVGAGGEPLFAQPGDTTIIATAEAGARFLAEFMRNPNATLDGVVFADPGPSAAVAVIEQARAITVVAPATQGVVSKMVTTEVFDDLASPPDTELSAWESLGK